MSTTTTTIIYGANTSSIPAVFANSMASPVFFLALMIVVVTAVGVRTKEADVTIVSSLVASILLWFVADMLHQTAAVALMGVIAQALGFTLVFAVAVEMLNGHRGHK